MISLRASSVRAATLALTILLLTTQLRADTSPPPPPGNAAGVVMSTGPACSGRSVLATPDGSWERFYATAGPGGADAMQLVHVTSCDNGKSWSQPRPLCDLPGRGWGGMAAVPTPSGDVHLFVTKGRMVGEGKVPAVNRMIDVSHFKSSDGRKTWTTPRPVFEGYVGAISNGVRMTSGRIVLPFGMMIGGRPAAPGTS